jgi:alkylation response protein AidB-like acyl-CoA dehydrogenase
MGGDRVAIDFRLTARQRELQLQSRRFAREVLSGAAKAEALPTPEERFAATKPAYEAMIAAGFLRRCIPVSAGGENTGLIDSAIMVEELYAVNASLTLTFIGTVLGLLPLLIGGTNAHQALSSSVQSIRSDIAHISYPASSSKECACHATMLWETWVAVLP